MYTTKARIYGTDGTGRRSLLHLEGARISDDVAVELGLIKGKAPAAAKAPDAAPATTAPAKVSYEDLKTEATALGLEFAGNLGSAKLTVLIDEAKAKAATAAAPTVPADGAKSTVDGVDVTWSEAGGQWIRDDDGEPFVPPAPQE